MRMQSMSDQNKRPAVLIEIERVQRLSNYRKLAPFARNQTTWELLLIISKFPNLQISEAVDMLKTRKLSHSSIIRFIQEQVSAGSLITTTAPKRSAKFLYISAEVEKELQAFLQEVYPGTQESHLSNTLSNETPFKTNLYILLAMSISLKTYKSLSLITSTVI
jgi:hypothetical protein